MYFSKSSHIPQMSILNITLNKLKHCMETSMELEEPFLATMVPSLFDEDTTSQNGSPNQENI